ncbi:MAG: sugar phosphate isomerase/epimerase [candidate division FCPU426 bacterium]
MTKKPVSLQLWSVRNAIDLDFAGTVKKVAAMGYAGVELAGYGKLDAVAAQKAVKDAGLRASGMHVGLEALQNELPRVVSEAKGFGAAHVTCPGWPAEKLKTRAECEFAGEELSRIGAKLRAEGLKFSYHNHGHEFAKVDGKFILDWMLGASEPRDLSSELDLYWVYFAEVDPAAYVRQLGSRLCLVHVKDGYGKGGKQTELGMGKVDYKAIFQALDGLESLDWIIVEQEEYNFDPMVSVEKDWQQLKAWGRA